MAQLSKAERKRLKDLRQDFETLPGYADILRKAAVNDWDTFEILNAITNSQTFRRQFPGLMVKGELNDFLTGRAGAPLSTSTLGTAISNYQQMEKAYQDAMEDFPGAVKGKLTRDRLATLMRQEKSPDEFRANLQAVQTVKQNPDLFAEWERVAKAAGIKGKFDAFRVAAKLSDQKFYDVYEAARLENMGLGLGAQDALKVARSLENTDAQGRSTGIIDTARLGDLVAEVKARQTDIGPELQREGISALDVSKWVASGGTSDPSLSLKLQSLVANKRARGGYVAGSQAGRGSGGGLSLYEDEGAANY